REVIFVCLSVRTMRRAIVARYEREAAPPRIPDPGDVASTARIEPAGERGDERPLAVVLTDLGCHYRHRREDRPGVRAVARCTRADIEVVDVPRSREIVGGIDGCV